MNDKEDSMELLEWDKKNIIQFAQYLYNLAKERVQVERAITSEEIVDEVTEEPVLELDIIEEETAAEVEEEELDDVSEIEVTEEIAEESQVEIEDKEEIESEAEPDEFFEQDEKHLDKELQEVTIGLAKAVSGEEIGDIDDTEQVEIQEIIQKEQIPLPAESKEIKIEKVEEPVESVIPESIESTVQTEQLEVSEEQINGFDAVDLSSPIVKEPIINEEVLIRPENIPEDIHNLVFVEEATSVPITKEEIIIKTTEITEDDSDEHDHGTMMASIEVEPQESVTIEPVEVLDSEREGTESIVEEAEDIHEEIVSEASFTQEITPTDVVPELSIEETPAEIVPDESPAEVPEEIPGGTPEAVLEPPVEPIPSADGLDADAVQRRQTIIEQMLAETKKREEKEGFKVRELGETAGKSYSAVVFGNESNKNVKKWKKWEKRRLRQEKKKKKK